MSRSLIINFQTIQISYLAVWIIYSCTWKCKPFSGLSGKVAYPLIMFNNHHMSHLDFAHWIFILIRYVVQHLGLEVNYWGCWYNSWIPRNIVWIEHDTTSHIQDLNFKNSGNWCVVVSLLLRVLWWWPRDEFSLIYENYRVFICMKLKIVTFVESES